MRTQATWAAVGLVAGLATTGLIAAAQNAGAAGAQPPVVRWQHLEVIALNGKFDEHSEYTGKLGDHGFELVATSRDNNDNRTYYYKRPAPQQ